MIIVTQKRGRLVFTENIAVISMYCINQLGEYQILATAPTDLENIEDKGIWLGEYKSEERANKILKEIATRYNLHKSFVYEMPEE